MERNSYSEPLKDSNDTDDSKESVPQKKESSFLRSLLRRLRPEQQLPIAELEEEEDDTPEVTDKKKTPFQKLFSKLFAQDVVLDKAEPSKTPEKPFSFLPSFSLEEETPAETRPLPLETPVVTVEAPKLATEEEVSPLETVERSPEIADESAETELPTELPELSEAPELPPVSPMPHEAVSSVPLAELAGDTVPAVATPEVVVEHRGGAGPALAGFVAAEVLSRHRDKKIRDEADKLRAKVTDLEKQQETTSQRLPNLERLAKAPPETPERQHPLFAPPEKKQAAPAPEISPQKSATTPERSVPPKLPEHQPVPLIAKVERQEQPKTAKLPETPSFAPENKQSELIFKQVEAAAEQNIAIEKHYERRHELKDEPSQLAGVGTDYAIGSSSTNSSGHNDHQASSMSSPQGMASSSSSKHSSTSSPASMYKQAATTGVVVAVVFLVLIGLVLFLG